MPVPSYVVSTCDNDSEMIVHVNYLANIDTLVNNLYTYILVPMHVYKTKLKYIMYNMNLIVIK